MNKKLCQTMPFCNQGRGNNKWITFLFRSLSEGILGNQQGKENITH